MGDDKFRVEIAVDKPTSGMWHCGPNPSWVTVTHLPTMTQARAYGMSQHKARAAAMACVQMMLDDSLSSDDVCSFPEALGDPAALRAEVERNAAIAIRALERATLAEAEMSNALDRSAENLARAVAAEAEVARLTRERDEARRRRDEWRRKADGYDAVCNALREKVGAPWPPHLSRVMWAGIAAAEKSRADGSEAEVARLREAELRATKALREIAGMDLMGASALAWNAARELEAAMKQDAPE